MAENNDQLQQGKINNDKKLGKGKIVDDDEFFNSLPVGYRFDPQDEELINHYLMQKLMNKPLPRNRIREVSLYNKSPQELTEMYKLNEDRETEWYFFTIRNRKYQNGGRPNRNAGNGYWKPTGTDKPIPNKEKPLGFKKSLDYYEGHQSNGIKTKWKMHEYVIPSAVNANNKNDKGNMQLDGLALCKIYKIQRKKNKNNNEDGGTSNSSTKSVPIANNFIAQLPNNPVQPEDLIINSTISLDNQFDLMCNPLQSLPSLSPLLLSQSPLPLHFSSLLSQPPPFFPLPSSSLPPLPLTLDNFGYDHMQNQPYEPSSYTFQFMHENDDHDCCVSHMAMDTKNYEVMMPNQPAIPLLEQNPKEETNSELVNHGATNILPNASHFQDLEENDQIFQNHDNFFSYK